MKSRCGYTRTERLVSALAMMGLTPIVVAASFDWVGWAGAGCLAAATAVEMTVVRKRQEQKR